MRPEHEHANRILQHWPDRRAMAAAFREVPQGLRAAVGALVRMQQHMFADYRFFAWCSVRPNGGTDGQED